MDPERSKVSEPSAGYPGITDDCDNVYNDCDGRNDGAVWRGAQTTTYRHNDFN
jgi:hypothetical protein